MIGTALSEEITAQECSGRFFHQETAFPGMRQVRRVEPSHGMFTKREQLPVSQGARRAIGKVLNRHQGSDAATERQRLGRCRKPLVKRAAFIGLDMGESNVTQPLHR